MLCHQVMDNYEEYNYEDYEQDKTRKHGSKKGAAQHKEQSEWQYLLILLKSSDREST